MIILRLIGFMAAVGFLVIGLAMLRIRKQDSVLPFGKHVRKWLSSPETDDPDDPELLQNDLTASLMLARVQAETQLERSNRGITFTCLGAAALLAVTASIDAPLLYFFAAAAGLAGLSGLVNQIKIRRLAQVSACCLIATGFIVGIVR
ncbi:MAG TPA: hypothetical protein VLF41_01465 [Candidatus Nanoarchaeia archaeon]|nr:hypothetical protein [Candidatus Nanoarchaeia archaeon]